MRNNILWAEWCNFTTQCYCQCFINWKSMKFNQFSRSWYLNLWTAKGPFLFWRLSGLGWFCLFHTISKAQTASWLKKIAQRPWQMIGKCFPVSNNDLRKWMKLESARLSAPLQAPAVLFFFFLFYYFYFSCVCCSDLRFGWAAISFPKGQGDPPRSQLLQRPCIADIK